MICLIIYLIGFFIVLFYCMKETLDDTDEITIGDLLDYTLLSIGSWFSVLFILILEIHNRIDLNRDRIDKFLNRKIYVRSHSGKISTDT